MQTLIFRSTPGYIYRHYKHIKYSFVEYSRSKKHVYNIDLKTFLSTFDIIHLSETWSDKKSKFDNFLSEYIHFDIVRTKITRAFRSGGFSVFIKSSTFRKYCFSA